VVLAEEGSGSGTDARTTRSEADLTVQQVVEMTGLGEHTLRYYERLGLLQRVKRDRSSGHRRYSAADVARLETLACLRAVGMSLAEMRQYMAMIPQGASAAARQRSLLEERKAVLEERMRQMRRNLEYVEHKIAYWSAVEAGDDRAAEEIARMVSGWIKADTKRPPDPVDGDAMKLRDEEYGIE
jgi:DNA-binding transcriptional MerR regulator